MCNTVAHTKCRTQIEEAYSSKSKSKYDHMPSCVERGDNKDSRNYQDMRAITKVLATIMSIKMDFSTLRINT